jgi:diguanylate cyclase (GGDEF)-like protein
MLDVDFFKEINDTWGHSTGDEALCDVANILKASIPENAIAIRYAGDEFIILLMTNNEQEIKKVLSDIQDSIKEFNERNERPYKLSVSMGTSVYQTEKTAEDLFLENMDKHMYEEKERKHHEYMLKNV